MLTKVRPDWWGAPDVQIASTVEEKDASATAVAEWRKRQYRHHRRNQRRQRSWSKHRRFSFLLA